MNRVSYIMKRLLFFLWWYISVLTHGPDLIRLYQKDLKSPLFTDDHKDFLRQEIRRMCMVPISFVMICVGIYLVWAG